MLTIYHLGISQSERIIWLCEELGLPYTLKRYDRTRGPMRKAIRYRSDRGFALAEARLADTPWLAGEAFTTAEIMMVFPFTTMRAFTKVKLDAYPNILAWLARIGDRPAYQRAMAAGDPGMTPLLT